MRLLVVIPAAALIASPASVRLGRRAEVVTRTLGWDASTPVLQRWQHGSLTCRLLGEALVCGNGRTTIRFAAAFLAVAS